MSVILTFFISSLSAFFKPHPNPIITLILIFNKLHFLFINHPLLSIFWHRI
jgi:hypothetical protein